MKKNWDQIGIAFSSACVVHCLLVAFIPLLLPVISVYTHSPWVHVSVAALLVIVSPLAFIPGIKKHGQNWILYVAATGLFLVVLGTLLEGKFSDQITHGVSIAGSLFLVVAHVKNIQHSHRERKSCCE